ncbi:hypothetical protein KUCAC02_018690, partial [Chaenocephalus aceratus]
RPDVCPALCGRPACMWWGSQASRSSGDAHTLTPDSRPSQSPAVISSRGTVPPCISAIRLQETVLSAGQRHDTALDMRCPQSPQSDRQCPVNAPSRRLQAADRGAAWELKHSVRSRRSACDSTFINEAAWSARSRHVKNLHAAASLCRQQHMLIYNPTCCIDWRQDADGVLPTAAPEWQLSVQPTQTR